MLFHSSIRKELARSFGAILVVLITVVMTMMLIGSLKQATLGNVNPSEVMMITGYSVLGHIPTILVLSLFIAIVTTLSRMYADSEMVIWFSAGRGLFSFAAPVFRFAWPVLLVIAILALFVWPWTNEQTREMKYRYEKRGDIERISPGLFQESAGGTRVFFIDKDSPDSHTGNNIFISTVERGKESVTSAKAGHIELVGDNRVLMLRNGQRVESEIGRDQIKVSEFEDYGTRIGSGEVDANTVLPPRVRSSLSLLLNPSPAFLGELAWRLGLAIAGFNLVLIALAVAKVNPRAGRGGNLLFALLTFVVYYNFLNVGQNWIEVQKVSFAAFMLSLHGGLFLLVIVVLGVLHQQWSLTGTRARLRGRATRQSP